MPLTSNQNLRCDVCGRFIKLEDIVEGRASFTLVTPDSLKTQETYEGLCREHFLQVFTKEMSE